MVAYFPDELSRQNFSKEHSLIIANHCYECDAIMHWMAIDKFGTLGNGKSFVKKSLKYVPVAGKSLKFLMSANKMLAIHVPSQADLIKNYYLSKSNSFYLLKVPSNFANTLAHLITITRTSSLTIFV